jgi:hypothetical protein
MPDLPGGGWPSLDQRHLVVWRHAHDRVAAIASHRHNSFMRAEILHVKPT